MIKLEDILLESPIIAAVKEDKTLNKALLSEAKVVFVLHGDILNIGDICKKLEEKGKKVFVHLDMIEGLRGDASGIEYIKKVANPYGIITTRPAIVKLAKASGLLTIIRVFIIDSLSLRTGIKNIHETNPSAIEVMPGVANKIINNLKREVSIPVIAGGLIDCKKDVIEALAAGALAVSTTCCELWNI